MGAGAATAVVAAAAAAAAALSDAAAHNPAAFPPLTCSGCPALATPSDTLGCCIASPAADMSVGAAMAGAGALSAPPCAGPAWSWEPLATCPSRSADCTCSDIVGSAAAGRPRVLGALQQTRSGGKEEVFGRGCDESAVASVSMAGTGFHAGFPCRTAPKISTTASWCIGDTHHLQIGPLYRPPPMKVTSLFSGCGGLDVGLHQVGTHGRPVRIAAPSPASSVAR